jgi:putative FmdB family regulatory protein
MPIFEYECQKPGCGKKFQQLFLGRDYIDPVCPTCRGEVKRLISEFSVSRGYPASGVPGDDGNDIEIHDLGSFPCKICGGEVTVHAIDFLGKKKK